LAAGTAAPGSPLVLLNRHARGGRAAAMGADLRGALSALSPAARLVATASAAEAHAAIAALPPCGRVVVVGGDGTVHHLLPALLAGGHELALVPAGSGDDTARAFGLRGLSWHDALRLALTAPSRPIDLGEVRTECGVWPFVSSLCIGFDAAISARAQQGPRWLAGLPRYLMATIAEIVRLQAWQVKVTVDGEPFHDGPALFASVVNTATYGGGMPIAPMARLDDARLDLVVAGRFGRVGALAMLPRLLDGTHLGHPRVAHATLARMQVLCADPLPMAADGEPLPAARAVDIQVVPLRLRVVTAGDPLRRDRRLQQG
jgi:diacylglycerol kinase family enzyme